MAFLTPTILRRNAVGSSREVYLGVVADADADTNDGFQVKTPLARIDDVEIQTCAWAAGQTSVAKQGMQVYRNTETTTENVAGKWGTLNVGSTLIASGDPVLICVRGV